MKYIEIDGIRYEIEACAECFFNYDLIKCLHPETDDENFVCVYGFPKMCPLREVEE